AQVVEFADRHVLLPHLLPDAVDVLGPAGDLRVDALRSQGLVQLRLDLLDVALAAGAVVVEQRRDATVGLGLQVAEREVLQLPLELPDAEPVGQRAWMSRVSCASARRSSTGSVAAWRIRASWRES